MATNGSWRFETPYLSESVSELVCDMCPNPRTLYMRTVATRPEPQASHCYWNAEPNSESKRCYVGSGHRALIASLLSNTARHARPGRGTADLS
jgi:hypothetical protein